MKQAQNLAVIREHCIGVLKKHVIDFCPDLNMLQASLQSEQVG